MLDLLIVYAILSTLGFVFTVASMTARIKRLKSDRDYYKGFAEYYYNQYVVEYMKGVEQGYVESSEVTY